MDLSTSILSDIVVYSKYARYISELKRRETWHELVTRDKEMHIKKYPQLKDKIEAAFQFVYDKKVLPSMRALKDDTPIYTKYGWKKVGEIVRGDVLYSSYGKETKVIATKSFKNKELYKITFSDKSQIIACGEHLWIVSTLDDLKLKRTRVVDTLFIKNHLYQGQKYKKTNIKIWNPRPIERDKAVLPIDPYILGHWLGDGYSAGYQYSTDEKDENFFCEEYSKFGYSPIKSTSSNVWTWFTHGLSTQLRSLNLINNKHLPEIYFLGSIEQRISLVQGLMDSDGHVTEEGRFLFYNTNLKIVNAMRELLSSLGIKFTSIPKEKKLPHHKDGFTISFFSTLPLARLPRKKDNIRKILKDPRTLNRSVKSVEPVGTGNATCFVVDSPDSSFLAGKKMIVTHNSLQFGGKPILISPNRQYNCCYLPMDSWEAFSEVMFLLLGGTGVGYSVQFHHIKQLPEIKLRSKRKKRYLISDSIEGWADAIKVLVRSYFFGLAQPQFDFSDIRPKGSLLKTSGGKAPGPQPLKDCIYNLTKILESKEPGDQLKPIEVHDLICHIADAVLAGGIRRAALISLFSMNDEEMLTCKYGNWWELNPQRGRANNSAVILRHRITKKKFMEFWKRIEASGCGEPGIFLTNNKEMGTNPCGEVALLPCSFCNLTTVNVSNIADQSDLNSRAKVASFIGTLQASYTDFHYLRDIWKENSEKDSLIGVSLTGVAREDLNSFSLKESANMVVEENIKTSKDLKINPAARTTLTKPEGTSSLVLGGSSGVHAWHSKFYIRRITLLKNEAIYKYLKRAIPNLIEDDQLKSTQAFVKIPIKAPEGAITRDESVFDLLERVKHLNINWIQPGHIKGDNKHNVSSTISIKSNEWDEVGEWMWENRDYYNGLTVLPFDGGTYKQAPFEEITEEEFNNLSQYLRNIDLTKVIEEEDNTTLKEQAACGGAGCIIT